MRVILLWLAIPALLIGENVSKVDTHPGHRWYKTPQGIWTAVGIVMVCVIFRKYKTMCPRSKKCRCPKRFEESAHSNDAKMREFELQYRQLGKKHIID